MSGTDQGADIRDCGGDVAAYALGALDRAEVEAFRTHLETCAVCRDELAAFQQVVDVVAMSVPQHRAPKRLRRRVLGSVAQEPQLGGGRRRRTPRWSARPSLPRLALALGAAVVIAALAVGGVELGSSGMTHARVYRAQVTGPGSAEVTVSDGHAELIVHHFAPPPAGQIYEVWLGRPGHQPAPTSALFSVTANGDGDIEVPGSLRGVNLVMVTPEPAGGSRVPTHPAVIRAQLS
jgi:anti-sigma-K factor RskA